MATRAGQRRQGRDGGGEGGGGGGEDEGGGGDGEDGSGGDGEGAVARQRCHAGQEINRWRVRGGVAGDRRATRERAWAGDTPCDRGTRSPGAAEGEGDGRPQATPDDVHFDGDVE